MVAARFSAVVCARCRRAGSPRPAAHRLGRSSRALLKRPCARRRARLHGDHPLAAVGAVHAYARARLVQARARRQAARDSLHQLAHLRSHGPVAGALQHTSGGTCPTSH